MKKILVILIALAALNQTEALEPKRDTQQQLKKLEDMHHDIAAYYPTIVNFNNRAELEKIRLNPVPDTTLEEVQLRNFAGFLLAWMEIEELGGPLYADDGVRELEALLKVYFIAPEKFPGVLRRGDKFLLQCKELLYEAAGITESTPEYGAPVVAKKLFDYTTNGPFAGNAYQAYFALALLFSGPSRLHDENKADELLHKIIDTQTEIDNALRNSSRVALARILEKKHDSKNQSELYKLLSAVSTDWYNNAGVYPDDAQFAQESKNRLFPQITYSYQNPFPSMATPAPQTAPITYPSLFSGSQPAQISRSSLEEAMNI